MSDPSNMRQELIPLEEPQRWQAALDGIPHAFGHTWENCYAMSLSTGHRTFLYQYESNKARIVCPISERRYAGQVDVVTPFGFSGFTSLGQSMEFSEVWLRFAREREWVCGYIGLNPLLECAAHYAPGDLFQQNELFYLDLRLNEAELYQRLSRCRKRQIKAWNARENWRCTDRGAIADFIIAQADKFFHSRGASSVYRFAPATWRSLLVLPNVELLGAKDEGRIVAATVFAYSDTISDAFFNISLPEGRDAATSLMWEGALRLKDLGITVLNMGGGVRQGDSVAQAKQRFGARVLPLRCLKQIYLPDRFSELCKLAGVNPAERTGYFPPYRAAGAQ
jgi:hypothetical protein